MSLSRLIAAACLTAALAAPTAATGADSPPLTADPAAVTLDEKGSGTVTVSNGTGLVLKLEFKIVGADGDLVSGATEPAPRSLSAGGATRLTAQVPTPKAAPTERSAGALVVTAAPGDGLPQGAVLRVPLQWAPAVKPAVKKWTLVREHQGAADDGTRLPLSGPCRLLGVEDGGHLGTVQARGSAVAITGSCPDAEKKVLSLVLSEPVPRGRSYEGTLSIGDAEVELTVVDTLSVAIVGLVLAISLLAGLGIALWGGGWRTAQRARQVAMELEAEATAADAEFVKAAEAQGLPSLVRAWRIVPVVRARTAELRATLRGFPTKEEADAGLKELTALQVDVRGWPEVANAVGEWATRRSRLAVLEEYQRRIDARTLNRPGPLAIDAIDDIKSAAKEGSRLAGDWPYVRIAEIARRAAALPPGTPARTRYDNLVEDWRIAPDLAAARAALKRFSRVAEAVTGAANETSIKGFAFLVRFDDTTAEDASFEPTPTRDPAVAARSLATRILTTDLLVLGALLFAAWVAGMQALWVDKALGGTWDLLSVVVWGLGGGAVSASLTSAVTNASGSWFAARRRLPT